MLPDGLIEQLAHPTDSLMTPTRISRPFQRHRGISLMELPQAFIIVGVLAAFVGLPRMLESVERTKATEAFKYLADVRHAQRQYFEEHGVYCDDFSKLDMNQNAPAYFSVGNFELGPNDGAAWSLTLTRVGGRRIGFDTYKVTFTDQGYDASDSDIDTVLQLSGRLLARAN